MIKKYLKSIVWALGIILVGTIIITILNYFNILNGIVLKVIELLIPMIAIFIGSYKIGKVSNNKGYIEGLKYGIVWMVLLITINLIIKSFTWTLTLYLLILILISTFSSIIGINKKK